MSEKQRIFTRFSYDHLFFSTANVFPSGWDLDYAQNMTNGRNILVADDLTLNSSTVLQLRYSFTRHHENQGGQPSYLSNINLYVSWAFRPRWPRSRLSNSSPFMIFGDLNSSAGVEGVGGTANYNSSFMPARTAT